MLKSKRFQNPLKSAHPPSQAHSSPRTQCPTHPPTHAPVHSSPQTRCARHPPTQAPPQSSPQTQFATHPLSQAPTHSSPVPNPRESSPLVEDSSDDTLNDTTSADSSSTPEIPQQSQPSRKYVGRESIQYWTVEAIGLGRAIEKIKVKVKEVNNLPRRQRIIVYFDDQGAPYGEAQGLLAGYCGTLATDCNLFPISFDKWSGPASAAKAYFGDCYEMKQTLRTTEAVAQRYCKLSIEKKWVASRQKLW